MSLVNQMWKAIVASEFEGRYNEIGRAIARELGVSKSTMWDFKQVLLSGAVSTDSYLTKPKILVFDIETSPLNVHNWSLWQNFTSLNQIQEDWMMLSYSAKWLGESEIFYDDVTNYKDTWSKFLSRRVIDNGDINDTIVNNTDRGVVASLVELMQEADMVIAHNGAKFDVKKVKARMVSHGSEPLLNIRVIDTLHIAKQQFALTSNKLDYLATMLGFENKIAHEGHGLWVKCLKGDRDAWKIMKDYNIWDTGLLEGVYLKIRAWDKKHPNVAVYYNDAKQRCPTCGSTNLVPTDKPVTTNLSSFTGHRCGDCGKVSRDATNTLSKTKRKAALRNII